MTVNYTEYHKEMQEFIEKHMSGADADFRVETSPMDQYGSYYKDYIFTDGAVWSEKISRVKENVSSLVNVHGIEMKISQWVELTCTEFWSTESGSKYVYEM